MDIVTRQMLCKYHAEYALLFGSYAGGEATAESDMDVVVGGGKDFKAGNLSAFGEGLRQMTNGTAGRVSPAGCCAV